ncbi:extracellular solute-binding protein [Sinorhizobium medicae]|uniref:ABC transporter substrate-binding protein n=1 Tax=Sinorhizobium medicae TaxID=110321 RepID=UPI001296CC83|nr:ABC transporter substrate-binding protein [Sinorhizobium medicae]MDX1017177.1 extracellular solute-binding protein [Sinorhizobium medicae]MDX2388248.1 extracellular solute-binding protein [Sinorhizobium medicae]MQU73560.1 extracellular solute-binding protein [Sinorhizobium medicae]
MKSKLMIGFYGLAALSLASSAVPATAQDRQVVISGSGGSYEKALREYWFDPFEKATGIKVVSVPTADNEEGRAKVEAMIKSGNVTWDIFTENDAGGEAPDHLMTRADDLSGFCMQFNDRSDLLPGSCKAASVLFASGATVIAYNKEHFRNGGPTTWKEFWDTEQFPGARGFQGGSQAYGQLTMALLADGVAKDKLYPMDVDRAFKKLDELRPNVEAWYTSGDQMVQGFRNGQFDAGVMYMTRVTALKNEGQPIGWSFNGALLFSDRYAVVKGAPHKAEALELFKFYLDSPEVQGKICEALSCVPPSKDALKYMSAETRALMPSPEQLSDMVIPDPKWVVANQQKLIDRWNTWIQQ